MRDVNKIIIILLIAGVVIGILNAPVQSSDMVAERTVVEHSDMFFTYTTVRYPARMEVLSPTRPDANLTFGVNAGSDVLDFSRLEAGGSVKKYINLSTTDGIVSRILVVSKGSISPLVAFDKNDFMLNGDASIGVTASAGSFPGNYTGEVDVIIKRSNNDVTRRLLGY